jgi:hypothetical protein
LGPDSGFAIFFDYTSFGRLLNPTPDTNRNAFVSTSLDWDVLLLDPDPALLADGVFDALSLVAAPLASAFSVDFLWMGPGSPGSQPFYFYQLDANGTPLVIGSGVTDVTPVPEPGTLMLLLTGCVGAAAARARRRQRHQAL